MEESQCVSANTGWQPKHLTAYEGTKLVGFMPLYVKTHSYGEYVFDFQWANAYHQTGLAYYPKLVCSIPFTPCSGDRIITRPNQGNTIANKMIKVLINEADRTDVSSCHILFPKSGDIAINDQREFLLRKGMQYHWFNKDYVDFDDFLSRCKMKPRKNIRRERKALLESNIKIKTVEGINIDHDLWTQFYYFYQLTYAKRSGNTGYLNQSFFNMLGKTMPSKIMMSVAELDGQAIAISLFFKDSENLYGRYWGTSLAIEYLHFELCYYQGIEYCIKNGLKHFDAGAQGEHKIQRGFEPIETDSYHWIADQRFRVAIRDFLNKEKPFVLDEIEHLAKKLPYKS